MQSIRFGWKNMSHMTEMRNAYKIFVRKHEGKRPLGETWA
jgi:hypothetical protein